MARARFNADYEGIGRMLNAPFMVKDMRRRAKNVAAHAAATAPRDTGDYAGSFKVSSGARGGLNSDRAYGRVTNSDQAAFYVEFGTSDTEARHTLRNALFEAAGD